MRTDTREPSSARPVLDVLQSIPGVRRAVQLTDDLRSRAVAVEAQHEKSSVLPVRNLGVRLLADRDACVAILKDGTFRPPGIPTVYLVEEGAPPDCAHLLVVGDRRYAVVGEEVVEGAPGHLEPVIPLERSFVIFPERRSGPQVSCLFVLPPVHFPELERHATRLGISDVVSISPSLAADGPLREALGFPPTNDLATLLIGFNWAPRGGR
jgi:hypothetical protein